MTREDEIFAEALALPAGERVGYLTQSCAGDTEMQARVEALLEGYRWAEGLLAEPLARRPVEDAEKTGDIIRHYRLLEKIGEGGCGVVYLAEQREPVRRRVALKVIKLGMDTKAVVARFEAERQALALMDHPNIARVFDAGATATGRPFFVMELVRGTPITRFCDERRLTPRQRIELFIPICRAIQHAHQKGIIHRDIKPSNILVTENDGEPTAKVIDFGIAKATQGRLTDQTLFTALEQFVGTPAYMSPEQAEAGGIDIDTRSDIYSLGVLLYELLTGHPPFDRVSVSRSAMDAIRDSIRRTEPPKPSSRLRALSADDRTAAAQARGMASADLSVLLRGDLDWIVMRCLEKDRTRRYDTAAALALDLERHLENEPVTARPPKTMYVLGKFVRRHRFALFAFGMAAVALIAGVVVSVFQAVRATRAELHERQLRVEETSLRNAVQAHAVAERRIAYASDMTGVAQALEEGNLLRARLLLNRQRPTAGQPDLRDWEWRYLWQFCQTPAPASFGKKPFPITSVSVSRDGAWIAAGEDGGGGLSLWKLASRQEIRIPAGRGRVRARFSPRDDLLVFTESAERPSGSRLVFWDTVTRQIRQEVPLPTACSGLAMSDDGATVVTSGENEDNAICVWRTADGACIGRFPAPTRANSQWNAFAATCDLTLAAHALPDRRLRVVDLRTGRELWVKKVTTDEELVAAAFSPDGRTLATAGGFIDPVIRLWDARTGAEISSLEGHRGFVANLTFSPDGGTLVSASADQTVRVWDVAAHTCRTVAHTLQVWWPAFLADGKRLVCGSRDGIHVWNPDMASRQSGPMTIPGVDAWRFVGGETTSIVAVQVDGTIARWSGTDFETRTVLLHPQPQRSVSLAPYGSLVALFDDSGTVHLWDWSQRVLVKEFRVSNGPVADADFISPGDRLLVLTMDGNEYTPREFDTTSGQEIRHWTSHPIVWRPRLAFSPDGRQCVIIRPDGEHWLINFETGEETHLAVRLRDNARGAFSPDGSQFAASSAEGYARIWSVPDFRELATLSGFMLAVNEVRFSPDGARLVTTGRGNEAVMVWDSLTHELLMRINVPGRSLGRLRFSPDGNVLGAVAARNDLFLWRAPTWTEVAAAQRSAGEP